MLCHTAVQQDSLALFGIDMGVLGILEPMVEHRVVLHLASCWALQGRVSQPYAQWPGPDAPDTGMPVGQALYGIATRNTATCLRRSLFPSVSACALVVREGGGGGGGAAVNVSVICSKRK